MPERPLSTKPNRRLMRFGTMAEKQRGKGSDKPQKDKKPSTRFSAEGYRELAAEATLHRERRFEEMGFPPEGPSLGDEEDETPPLPEPLPAEREEAP